MEKILEVSALTKVFKTKPPFVAVDGISFHLNEGEILGFLGPNGAGKTTTIQMLLGTLLPTSGDIRYFGRDFLKERSEILRNVSFASTYLSLPKTLTIEENLQVFGMLYGIEKKRLDANIKKYLHLFEMWNFRDRVVSTLSAGQMTRVMLAKAFLSEPRVVLLDEPTASLDPDICADVRAFVLEQQRLSGTSMVFTSHNMAEVEEVCDRVLVLKKGKIIADQRPEDLAKSVSRTKVCFLGIDRARFTAFAAGKVDFEFLPHEVEVAIDEDKIPWLFNSLAQSGITYSQVSIEKPTLEDYFLQVAKG